MVPLGTLASVRDESGPVMVMRYNMYPAAAINVTARPGVSSGQAIEPGRQGGAAASWRAACAPEWTELALLQLQTGNTAMLVFLLAVVLVFLVLAAQYESWSLPLAVILVVPMCLLCSIAGVLAGQDGHQHFHAGRLRRADRPGVQERHPDCRIRQEQRENGVPRHQATLEACALRLRPIIMTSFAFILGVVPLLVSEGRRRRNAPDARHRRLFRHAGRDALRHLSDAGLLLRHPVV